jgi:hypothetical protein
VDVSGSINDDGSCSVSVGGGGGGSGLNYKLGTTASLSVLLDGAEKCRVDRFSGTVQVGVPFTVDLEAQGGGSIPSHMTLSISSSGVSIAGVTIGTDDTD